MAVCTLARLVGLVVVSHSVLLMADIKSDANQEITVTAKEMTACEEPQVAHGVASEHQGNYSVGERAEIVCTQGYRFLHNKSPQLHVICSTNGTWVDVLGQSDIPPCERIGSCPLPQIVQGMVLERDEGYMPGDRALVVCELGYGLATQASSYLVCQNDGSWRTSDRSFPALPRCEELICSLPAEIPHATYRVLGGSPLTTMAVQGTRIYYTCVSGYRPLSESDFLRSCRSGRWSGAEPRCVENDPPNSCGQPQDIPNTVFKVVCAAQDCVGLLPGDLLLLPQGARVDYECRPGYKQYGTGSLTCAGGHWDGMYPTCTPIRVACPHAPTVDFGSSQYVKNIVQLPEGVAEGTQAFYFCQNGYRIEHHNMSLLTCRDSQWQGTLPTCVKRAHCDKPMGIPNGEWIIISPLPDYSIGARVRYECDEQFRPVGVTTIECLDTGYWSENAPRCLPKGSYCSEPGPIDNGFYMCKPSHCNLYKVSTEVHYVCNKNYDAQDAVHTVQVCLRGGLWSGKKPICSPQETTTERYAHLNTSTLTVVIATSCGVLGLLVIVMVIVALQRRVKPRGRLGHAVPPPPPPYNSPPRSSTDEHDRVALIAFAEGVQVVLPSYEEAVRGRHAPRLARFNSDTSSHSSSGRSSRNEYRPLPSIPPNLRSSGGPQIRELPPDQRDHHRDHHRNSIITTTSITTRDNLSLALGSLDTVNISDGTSTSVTVDTYDSGASNPSIATSQRAAAGSLESSSTHGSLAAEDAPLLDQSYCNTDTLRSQGSRSQNSEQGGDSLRNQGNESSPIMQIPEQEGKLD